MTPPPSSTPGLDGRRRGRTAVLVRFGLGGCGLVGLLGLVAWNAWTQARHEPSNVAGKVPEARPTPVSGGRPETLHPVHIKRPAGPPQVATGLTNLLGAAVTVSCGSCHATTTPGRDTRRSSDLDQFHQGLRYSHGDLTCLSCHNSADYDTLRLADQRPVQVADVMNLCSQCHGPQRRDYDQGLHGGMNGHWDLRRGGRTRNNCITCHDPHNPAYPVVMPVLPPRDRFSVKPTAVRSGH